MTDVDCDDGDGKRCDEYGNVEVRAPVLYDYTGSREVIWKDNCIFEKIVPTRGVPEWCQSRLSAAGPSSTYPRAGSTNRVA